MNFSESNFSNIRDVFSCSFSGRTLTYKLIVYNACFTKLIIYSKS